MRAEKFIESGDTKGRGNPYRMLPGYISVTVGRSSVNGFVTDPVTMAYHELRSPLALMATLARSTAEDCADEDLRGRCLSILETAERMLRTAGQMMVVADAARDESQRRFSVEAIVTKVVGEYRTMSVPVTLEISPGVQSDVFGAPGILEALLCSILGNALDHGRLDLPVRVSVSQTTGAVFICVQNALGRSHTHKGIGLGSYIGERLAQALNASFELTKTNEEFTAKIAIPVGTRELRLAV